jgi:UDP-N-acetyl-D-glucosamine dehydrogenase
MTTTSAQLLADKIKRRTAKIGVVGLGYVGLPLAIACLNAGYNVIGFDIDQAKVTMLQRGQSPIGRIPSTVLMAKNIEGKFIVSTAYASLQASDIIVICVPTPLNKHREPDLSYIVRSTNGIAEILRAGQLISLESTTYPGTTRDIMRPILEAGGLKAGSDFFLAYSPEREDPGNPDFHTATIPKVVGGDGPAASSLATAFYASVVERVVPVSSCEVAEAVKLTENIFRSVNIALVNELKVIYGRMGINVWEVIDAAKTKPFGFMPFYPGPGLGGHCIPIDPFYLTWKAREFDVPTRFIELAGEINTRAPYFVVDALVEELGRHKKKAVNGSRILMVGLAYKKNVEDTRESPAFTLIRLIKERGGEVDFHDPFVPEVPNMREHPEMAGHKSIAFNARTLSQYDAAVICTDHDGVDYALLARSIGLVIDTRNALKHVLDRSNIVMA